jgi:hypothetical protein
VALAVISEVTKPQAKMYSSEKRVCKQAQVGREKNGKEKEKIINGKENCC